MNGFYLRLPFSRSCFVEKRRVWVGFGVTGDTDDRLIYLGQFQITIAREYDRAGG